MKVFNFIWGYALGAGIDRCFLTYTRLGEVAPDIEMKNLCIRIKGLDSHTKALERFGVGFIDIKSRKDLSWIGKLAKAIKAYNPDVVFTHGFNGAIIMLILRILKRIKVKCVFTYHGLYNPPTKFRTLLSPAFNRFSVISYRICANRVICVSNDSGRQLLDKGIPEHKIAVVYNGITNRKYITDKERLENCVTLLSASRIDKIKGLDYLLESLSRLSRRHIDFHYYMVGDGPDLFALKEKARELGIAENITFVGFQDDVPQWLDKVDIFVLPSLQENHSIALLEAMRAGKGIVATNVGGNPESIRDGIDGLLVPAKDPKALADALEKMLTDKELRDRCSASAQQRFEEVFTEESMMRNLAKVLRDAVVY